jgi:hypothetical protein
MQVRFKGVRRAKTPPRFRRAPRERIRAAVFGRPKRHERRRGVARGFGPYLAAHYRS